MTSESARRYLIAYDIADDRRRTHVAYTLGSHGDRVQFSVFLVDARPARLVRLKAALSTLINPEYDSILVCDLGLVSPADQRGIEFLGRARPTLGQGPVIL